MPLSYDQLTAILHGIADGITVQDPSGRLLFANLSAARIMGFDRLEELLNTPLEQFSQKFEYRDESGEPIPSEHLPGRLALRGEKNPSAVIHFRDLRTGQDFWSLVKARPVFNSLGQVEMAVNIFHDITELKRLEQAENFLAEAGKILSSSLDYTTTLKSIAQMTVSKLADWCTVVVVEEDEAMHRIAIAHADPEKLALARHLQEQYPLNWGTLAGSANVLQTGRPEYYPEITDEDLKQVIQDPQLFQLLRDLGLKSAIILPLVARGQTLGVLSLVWAESGRRYTPADVLLAEELARRAANAIDNSRLYHQAQKLNEDLEARVNRRTEQLHTLIDTLRNEIAERKKTEEELRKNEAVLNSLFESAPDGQVIVDGAGNIVRVNAQLCEMFGYRLEELVGKSVEILLPERFKYLHLISLSAYMEEPRHRSMGLGRELFGRRRDGREFPVDIMLSSLHGGEDNQVIAAIRDITDRKQIEAELEEVQRRLIENVEAERLSLAQELHDGPVQDLYGIAYKLNALEAILGEQRPSSSEEDPLSISKDMIQQVIDALRSISVELRPPALAPYGLEKAIRAHIDSLRPAHPELEIQLDLMTDGQILSERIRLALYRIYQHAVSNVVRHAKAEHLHIRFTFDAEQVILEIKDDGCGFNLPARWIKLAREGHLGLVGTSERVKAIGGNLEIETSPGQGTLVRVSVPQ